MLLSVIQNKLFCKKLWGFCAFSVLVDRFLPANHFVPHCWVSVSMFGIWAWSETTDVSVYIL